MANKTSPVIDDVYLNSTASTAEEGEDDLLFDDFSGIDSYFNPLTLPFDILSPMSYSEEKTSVSEPTSIDQLLSDTDLDILRDIYFSPFTPQQQYIVHSSDYSSIDEKYKPDISLPFINAPEPFYHVRYLSEITDSPLDGNVVHTRTKTKKNISGRYLKGIRGRYVTITLPSIFSDCSNLYVRVTRLTVPYRDISFIHPYPLFYSCPKKISNVHVIIQNSSVYYKVTKEELCSGSKHFPNLILTRHKQCELKRINSLCRFDNSGMWDSFEGDPKTKISTYQLKKSQLDFRVVVLTETGEFVNTEFFCRSNSLIEAEGFEGRISST